MQKKYPLAIMLTLFLFVFFNSFTANATQETPQSFTFDGRAYSDSGGTTPLLDSSVLFKVQILNPAQDCVLYEEQQTVSTLISNGYFNISVGSAASDAKRTVGGGALDSNNEMNLIFSNTQASVSGKKLSDGSACTYTPASGDKKYVRMQMTPSSDGMTRTLAPMMALDSVPSAVVAERAESLQGLVPSQLLQTNSGGGVALTQANLESVFSATNYTRLSTLVSVPPANYVQTGSNGSATIPSVAGNPGSGLTNGQIWYDSGSNSLKYYNGSVQVLATGSGTVTSVTGTSPISVVNGTSTPVISIAQATSSVSGYLSSADWTLFNSKLSGINSTDVTTALGYTPANNSASWSTDGTNVYRTTGNVGVGTAAPGYNLDVIGQSRTQSDTGPAYNIVHTANAGASIGSGMALLRSRGTVTAPTFPQSGDILGSLIFSNHQIVTGASITAVAVENQSGFAGGTDLKFSTTAIGGATLPERMRISNNGNVGIGTTTPGSKLVVTDAGGTMTFTNPAASAATLSLKNDSSVSSWSFVQGWTSFQDLAIFNGSTRIANFTTTGMLVGPGSTPAINRFDVNGNAAIGSAYAGTSTAPTDGLIVQGNVGIGTSTPSEALEVVGNIKTSGCLYYASSSLGTCASDERLKEDVHSFDLGLDTILGINPVNFKYNGLAGFRKDHVEQLGVIAQDVEKVAPLLVKRQMVKLHEADKEKTEIKVVDYGAFTYVIINSLKELYHKWFDDSRSIHRDLASIHSDLDSKVDIAEVELLKIENAQKEKKIKELESRLEKIEKALGSK